jgi:hypothetical protein
VALRTLRTRVASWATLTMSVIALLLTSCAPATDSEEPGGPGGSGIVSADPDAGPAAVEYGSACNLVEASPTLQTMGAVGAPADTQFTTALSYCQFALTVPSGVEVIASVEIVPATDLAQTVALDPATFGGTIVPLPDLGEYGQFVALSPNVDPVGNPDTGAISSARGELGVTLGWGSRDSGIVFTDLAQAVRELLDALP